MIGRKMSAPRREAARPASLGQGESSGPSSDRKLASSFASLSSARELLAKGEPASAVVVAQAGAEVAMAIGVRAALDRRVSDAALAAWITRRDVRGQSFSPDSERIQALWTALTGDNLTRSSWWLDYARGVGTRDLFVHEGGAAISKREAETFVAAVAALVRHVAEHC